MFKYICLNFNILDKTYNIHVDTNCGPTTPVHQQN